MAREGVASIERGAQDLDERSWGRWHVPAANRGDAEWPLPHPIVAHQLADPYPLDALPAGIGDAVREVVAFVQCPPALAACSALSAISIGGQGLANVKRTEHLIGPISLYILAVAESGERKSTCDTYFQAPILSWEREQREVIAPLQAKAAAALRAWEARRDGLLSAIKSKATKGSNTDELQRSLENLEADKPRIPPTPRVLRADSTPEATAHSLATGWRVGGVMAAEAGIVFGAHGMNADSIMRNLALLNILWDGGSLQVDRRQSDGFILHGARLTVGLAAQPATVEAFIEASKGLARGTGFAARFLIAWPESTQGQRRFVEAPPWKYLPAFGARLGALLRTPLTFDSSGGLELPALEFEPEGQKIWISFYDDVESELRPGGEMADVRDVASKAADNVARLAALFHVFQHGPVGSIGAHDVTAAVRIIAWHLYESRRFLGEIALPREQANALKLDIWLRAHCRARRTAKVSTRDVLQRGPAAIRKRLTLELAVAELAELGRVRGEADGRQRWLAVNPALLEI